MHLLTEQEGGCPLWRLLKWETLGCLRGGVHRPHAPPCDCSLLSRERSVSCTENDSDGALYQERKRYHFCYACLWIRGKQLDAISLLISEQNSR